MIVRVLLWSLFDSKTTIGELRDRLPSLEAPTSWIWNEATERFGLIVFGDALPADLETIRDLIGHEAEVYEEFDVLP